MALNFLGHMIWRLHEAIQTYVARLSAAIVNAEINAEYLHDPIISSHTSEYQDVRYAYRHHVLDTRAQKSTSKYRSFLSSHIAGRYPL